MIWITGDLHGDHDYYKLYTKRFPAQKKMTKDDVVIICGDFGGVWMNPQSNNKFLKKLEARKFTTLFCDGNHENFELLNQYPIVEKYGGKVHQISDSIFHLMRGECYQIDGKSFFVMGGASSHDRPHIQGRGWWKEELPSEEEFLHAKETLDRIQYKVDYVITHCAPLFIQEHIDPYYWKADCLNSWFDELAQKLTFKKWFFGHHHRDIIYFRDNRFEGVYRGIFELTD